MNPRNQAIADMIIIHTNGINAKDLIKKSKFYYLC